MSTNVIEAEEISRRESQTGISREWVVESRREEQQFPGRDLSVAVNPETFTEGVTVWKPLFASEEWAWTRNGLIAYLQRTDYSRHENYGDSLAPIRYRNILTGEI